MRLLVWLSAAVLASALPLSAAAGRVGQAPECVVLLHGLARTAASMARLEEALTDAGFAVANIDYPSRKYAVQQLAPMAMEKGLAACRSRRAETVHVVTHSLGGILVRYYLAEHDLAEHHLPEHHLPKLGRVVMLGPPNRGSQVVDKLAWVPGFGVWNGPAGFQLGTGEDSLPRQLGPARFAVGVIAGTRSLNPVFSRFLPGPDDGKVALESTKLAGMQDFLALPHTHTFMMRSTEVIRQTIFFLRNGRFDHTNRPRN